MGLGMKLLKHVFADDKKKTGERKHLLDGIMEESYRTSDKSGEDPAVRSRREAMERFKASNAGALAAKKEEKAKTAAPASPEPVVIIVERPLKKETPEWVEPKESKVYDMKYTNTALAKFAMCKYLAGLDDSIGELERIELGYIIDNINRNPRIPSKYKGYFTNGTFDEHMSFADAKLYLDKADASDLLEFVGVADWFARRDGITEAEKAGIDAFKLYVEQRTGHKFTNLYMDPESLDLTCPSCGAVMKLDENKEKACCSFCGMTRLLDANRRF